MTFPHGTATGCRNGCGCRACRAAATLSHKRWLVRAARQGPLIVPSDTARTELAALDAVGLSNRRIAAMCGVHQNVTSKIRTGRAVRVKQATAARIHALWVDYCGPVPAGRRSYPTGPLLAAMADVGVTRQALERRIGVEVQWARPTVSWRVADAAACALGSHIDLIWTNDMEVAS